MRLGIRPIRRDLAASIALQDTAVTAIVIVDGLPNPHGNDVATRPTNGARRLAAMTDRTSRQEDQGSVIQNLAGIHTTHPQVRLSKMHTRHSHTIEEIQGAPRHDHDVSIAETRNDTKTEIHLQSIMTRDENAEMAPSILIIRQDPAEMMTKPGARIQCMHQDTHAHLPLTNTIFTIDPLHPMAEELVVLTLICNQTLPLSKWPLQLQPLILETNFNSHTSHSMNEYGSRPPPTGPAADQNSFAPPSGPMSHFGHGGSGRGNFRGMPFAGRAPPRGPVSQNGFRGGQSGFNHFNRDYAADDSEYQRQIPENGYDRPDERPEPMDVDMDSRGWNSTHDSSSDNRNSAHKPDPPKNAPSGPAAQSASKFSFAFKSTSKPTLAAPKPEISQKLNAAPRKPAIFQNQKVDRDPPPGAPTQPSNRGGDMRKPPDGPRMAPRMRKVKKIVRKPKPRPALAPELVTSESVFYRKPGNGSVVGSGTYGKVFKGLNVYTKDSVALKKIRMEGERDGFPVTAVREIKLLQSLRHVNIVNLQEVMVEQNDCFMVFEYLAYDLTGILHHPSFKLQAPQKKDLARQLFEGLDYLHTRGVLHRDIKAANILVGKDGILKIADFGLARFYAKHHQLEYTNRVITIWYRSPELLLGETKYTAAVDVWSAACVMMEIFTSLATFAGDGTELSQLEKIYSIMGTPNRQEWPGLVDMAWFELLRPAHKRKSVFAERFQDKLTPAAFELMQSMFHYDPAKRPSAAEVLRHPYFTNEEPPAKQATE